MLTRYDLLAVGRAPSVDQVDQPAQNDPVSFSDDDHVFLFAGGAYVQATSRWTPWFRSVIGVRDDFQHGTDVDYLAALHETAGYTNAGTAQQNLVQPKGSLIFTPTDYLEFYLSAGRGFHSADLRGVNQDVSVDLGLPHTNLLSKQEGQEVGMRAAVGKDLTFTFALYNLWQQSETIIDPDVGADTAGPPRAVDTAMNSTSPIKSIDTWNSTAATRETTRALPTRWMMGLDTWVITSPTRPSRPDLWPCI